MTDREAMEALKAGDHRASKERLGVRRCMTAAAFGRSLTLSSKLSDDIGSQR